ncbi:MAG: hypothetical protein ABR535_03955, partial [Pyrinomonadaceae bacterium]
MKREFSLLTLSVFLIAAAGACRESEIVRIARGPNGGVVLSRENMQTTSAGTRVFSKSPITSEQLAAIDRGTSSAFVDARASGYSQKLSTDFYEI